MAIKEDIQMYSKTDVSSASAGRLTNSRDAAHLAQTGKQPVLKRNFGFMSMVGLACTLMSTWEGILILFAVGYENGGPAGLIYGFLAIWVGTLSTFVVMSELVSMIPSAGGQYHWVFLLAPKSCRKILSYITGWLTVIGWTASVAAASFFTKTLLLWAAVLIAVLVNIFISAALPQIKGFILIFHILGFFALLIPLVFLGPHGDTKELFTTFLNGGAWPTQGLSFFIGLAGYSIAFIGADGAVNMCEEVKSPQLNVPRAMITGIIINGALAFGMLLALLYCAGNLEAAFESSTGFPFIEIFTQATSSVRGATAMTAIVAVISFFATIGTVAASSRQLWAFARDRGVPGWRTLNKIDHRTSVPLAATCIVAVAPCLLALINIGSTTIFNDIISLILAGLFSSYEIAALLLLYHRCTGGIYARDDNSNRNSLEHLTWGPWRINGALGIANNMFACCYLLIIEFFSFFPPTATAVPSTMNYSVLVFGATVIFSMVYYLVWARKSYVGPAALLPN